MPDKYYIERIGVEHYRLDGKIFPSAVAAKIYLRQIYGVSTTEAAKYLEKLRHESVV